MWTKHAPSFGKSNVTSSGVPSVNVTGAVGQFALATPLQATRDPKMTTQLRTPRIDIGLNILSSHLLLFAMLVRSCFFGRDRHFIAVYSVHTIPHWSSPKTSPRSAMGFRM